MLVIDCFSLSNGRAAKKPTSRGRCVRAVRLSKTQRFISHVYNLLVIYESDWSGNKYAKALLVPILQVIIAIYLLHYFPIWLRAEFSNEKRRQWLQTHVHHGNRGQAIWGHTPKWSDETGCADGRSTCDRTNRECDYFPGLSPLLQMEFANR